MPVTAADLTYPVGEIRSEWFEGEDLAANLSLWITAGEVAAPAGSTEEQIGSISLPYAYWRAYDAKVMEMAGNPDSSSLGDLSATIKDGRTYFNSKAKQWKAEYEVALAAVAVEDDIVSTPAPRTSASVPFVTVF